MRDREGDCRKIGSRFLNHRGLSNLIKKMVQWLWSSVITGDMIKTAKWQRIQFVALRNFYTGNILIVDTFAVRLGRMKKSIIDWAYLVDKFRSSHKTRMVMVTLTYRRGCDYKPGHIGDYLRNLKKRLGSALYAFAWVAELQKRRAVHYHVILVVEPGSDIPMPDKKGYWTHGMSKIETAKTAFYLATYAGKQYQKSIGDYPKSCRLYATSIRPAMKNKLPIDLLEAFSRKRHFVTKTAEGETVWKYEASGATEDYARLMAKRTVA